MITPSEPPEHHFTLNLRTGQVRPTGETEGPDHEEEWTEIGELDPVTGSSTVDVSKASGWRPVEEFLWRR
jgi:hypothetical protein